MVEGIREHGICAMCGEEGELTFIGEEGFICDQCLDDWEYCDICQEYYSTIEIEFTETEDGRRVCEWCAEDLFADDTDEDEDYEDEDEM